jgi:hypothetical protein
MVFLLIIGTMSPFDIFFCKSRDGSACRQAKPEANTWQSGARSHPAIFGLYLAQAGMFCWVAPRVARTAATDEFGRARAYSDPMESDRGSSFLFSRIFFTQTGVHFA